MSWLKGLNATPPLIRYAVGLGIQVFYTTGETCRGDEFFFRTEAETRMNLLLTFQLLLLIKKNGCLMNGKYPRSDLFPPRPRFSLWMHNFYMKQEDD